MKRFKKLGGLLFWLNLWATAAAQLNSPEEGQPLIRNFFPEEYHSDITCTSLLQGQSGLVYVANERGVLEYDGAGWRLISVPIGQDVRALAQAQDGLIYTGGLKNMGYLSPNDKGQLQFHSLVNQLPEEQRNFGFFREALSTGDTVYLRGEQLLVQLANRQVLKTWPVNGWRGLFQLNGKLYVDQLDPGLCVLEKGHIKLIPGGERFARTHVYVMQPLGGDILIGTMDQGLIRYKPWLAGAAAFQPFPSELNSYFLEHQCYSGLPLPDGRLALGTFTGGLAIVDSLGRQQQLFHRFPGHTVRVVEDMMTDRQGALWFTSENGISRVEIHLPLTYWGKEKGLSSRLTSITRFAGHLFIATYNGLMVFNPEEYPEAPFQQFGQLGKIINPIRLLPLPAIDGKERLIIGGSSGLAEVTQGEGGQWQTRLIDTEQNAEFLYHFPAYPRRIYVLNRVNNLVRTLQLEEGQWVEDSRITIEGPSILGADTAGRVWAGTYQQGLALLALGPEGKLLDRQPTYYGKDKGLSSEKYTAPLPLSDGLYFLTEGLASKFNVQAGRFEPAAELNAWLNACGANFLETDNQGNLFLTRFNDNSYYPLGMAFLQNPGAPFGEAYQLDTSFHKRLPQSISSIFADGDSILWIGTNNGLFRYNRKHPANTPYPLTVYLRKVAANQDSVLFGGAVSGKGENGQSVTLTQPLGYRFNNLFFSFAAQGYDDAQKNQYSYSLEGFDRKWSPWSTLNQKEYTNIPQGDYTFRVKARDIYGNISPEARLQFTISSPWWRTPFTYLGLSLLIMTVIWLWMRHRTRLDRQKLARQKAQLEKERELNERLRHVDHLKDQFLANTSHELRTPLHGIIGLAESLEEREESPDKKEDIQMIISSGKRLSSLVNDILDFSRLKNHEIELKPRSVDMHALVDVVLRIHTPLARGKDLALKNRVPLRGSIVHGDENRLMQVMHNLVGNGIKFTESGHVRVAAKRKEEWLEVSVEDTGVGIPETKKEAIFQEFEQADGSERRLFTGTGLGLSVSKRLIEMHGGQLWVKSEEGRGSTFYFTLPLSIEKRAPDMAPPEPASRPEESPRDAGKARALQIQPLMLLDDDSEKVRILIVDDEPINQRVLTNHLRQEQYKIISAMNGREALQAIDAADRPFDLVLLDVMMPRMSGYEVCQKIRERHLPSELPVIMVTAKNQVADLVEGLAVGANDYLAKPFTREEFLARVKTHLYLHRINAATGKFVPYEFLQALGRDAITEVRLGDQALREVTVFFSDIRGYTTLAETMSPTDNFRFVNALNGRLGPHIRNNNGFINQYLGDAIMAIFPGEPMDAVTAAVQMQKALHEYNHYRKEKQRRPIRLGMGIHTGPLIMGIIGDNKRMDAATIADTVNTASRVESLTKFYGANILLTEESLQRISHKEDCLLRYLGKVQVIGKKKPLGMYECFNGDEPWQQQQKQESLAEFREAVDAYFSKDFWDAGHILEGLLKRYPDDGAVRFFLSEARRLASEGVPEEWTGIVEMKSK